MLHTAPAQLRCAALCQPEQAPAAAVAAAQTSVMGVSRTRLGPYFCSRPRVILYAPCGREGPATAGLGMLHQPTAHAQRQQPGAQGLHLGLRQRPHATTAQTSPELWSRREPCRRTRARAHLVLGHLLPHDEHLVVARHLLVHGCRQRGAGAAHMQQAADASGARAAGAGPDDSEQQHAMHQASGSGHTPELRASRTVICRRGAAGSAAERRATSAAASPRRQCAVLRLQAPLPPCPATCLHPTTTPSSHLRCGIRAQQRRGRTGGVRLQRAAAEGTGVGRRRSAPWRPGLSSATPPQAPPLPPPPGCAAAALSRGSPRAT